MCSQPNSSAVAWFVVDDGSSDKTAAIIERMALQYPLIQLQSAGSRGGRNFGSQYKAIMAAYALAKSHDFEFVGVVDADQAPERKDYYESILQEFERNPKLGVASGFIYERANGIWKVRPENSDDSVAASASSAGHASIKLGGTPPSIMEAQTG